MNKKVLISIITIVIIALIAGGIFLFKGESTPEVETEIAIPENLENIVTNINETANLGLASLQTNVMDVSDADSVTFYTGLSSAENVEELVVSEPMMSSQAYSLVLVKAKEGADVETMKSEMLNNIDTRKWICVTAEKVYVTNHGNVICLVMASEEWAKPSYDAFKAIVNGNVGKELERTEEI